MSENAWSRNQRTGNGAPAGSSLGAVSPHASIGASVVIKGEVSGTEPLFIDGTVEGSISFPETRVTVGRTGYIRADIRAHDVVVMGAVEGNIYCTDLLDIRPDGSIKGHLIAERIQIDDGANLKGSVEVHSAKRNAELEAAFRGHPTEAAKATETAKPSNPEKACKETLLEAAAAVSVGAPVRRLHGSRTLVEPTR
jgi:cytoskeletal protein CcmA (bactofilin family)